MANNQAGERTEKPTARRLSKSRSEGKVPQSHELPAAFVLLMMILVLWLMGPQLLEWCSGQVRSGLSYQPGVFTNTQSFIHFANGRLVNTTMIMLPVLLGLTFAGVLGCVVVSGFNYAPKGLKPNWAALNPFKGLGNIFSARSGITLIVSILKLAVVIIVTYVFLRDQLMTFINLRWSWSTQILTVVGQMIFGIWVRLAAVILIISIAEALYQKWKYIEDLKMTKQEIKEEHKMEEGSPEVKRRIRLLQYELASKRMLQEVPKANVILVNPTHVAVALKYDSKKMDAPVLVAKGGDHLCEKIKEIGRAYGIPIVHRPELARSIFASVEPGQAIPEVLYVAVAEVLAIIYRLRHRR
jgi:flagellar biosynthesis protein FlhB